MKRSFWWRATIVFALVVAANYLPVFTGKIPFPRDLVLRHAAWAEQRPQPVGPAPEIGDLITSFYPFHTLAAMAIRERSLPLWNPYILGGAPFEANSQSALFYPFNFLYYVLPVAAAWSLCLMIRMFLAATFMALFMNAIGASNAGSIVSGITFAACGFTTAWQGQALGDAAIWLPLICYSIHRLHQDHSYGSIALAGFAFAMPVLAGHPETALHVTATGSALALMLCTLSNRVDGKPSLDWRFVTCFLFVGVLALGLASVQMIPSLEWVRQMGSPFDLPWPALSRHDGQGFFSRDLANSPNSAGLAIPETAAYIGMFSLLAAPFALFHKSRPYVLFLSFVTIVAAAIAFGIDPLHWLVSHTPLIKSLKNGRLILVASFGTAAMAGLGVSVLADWVAPPLRLRATGLAILLAAGAICAFCIYETHLATLRPVDLTRGPAASLVFLAISALFLGLRVIGKFKGSSFPILGCALIAFELVTFSYGYTGYTRSDEIFPTAPVFEFLHGRGDHATFRIAKGGFPVPANSGIVYDLEAADGYEVCTAATKMFTADLTEDRQDAVFFLADKLAQSTDRRVDMLNVKYLIVITPGPEFDKLAGRPDRYTEVYKQGSIAVFENRKVLPRLIAVPQEGVEIIEDAVKQLERIKDPDFDPERTALFSNRPSALRAQVPSLKRSSAQVTFIRSGNNGSTFRIRSSEPSALVLSQIYYPGWKATVDGLPTPVYPVNYALTGILAPAGTHEIQFFFSPRSFTVGAAVSGMSLVLIVGLLTVGKMRPGKKRSSRG